MIDTGCQVTNLATSVFERMCVADPRFRCRLWPCRRRLVSADSSPLMVRGELCMTVVFPGLQCDMTLVIASIGSEGLLGTEVLQLCCLTSLICAWDSYGSMDNPHCSCISNVTEGSLVIPPDSEIVAPVSIRSPAGIPPGRCFLIEPDLTITENYGVLVGQYFSRHVELVCRSSSD